MKKVNNMVMPGISACLIVKNEEKNLPECLESIYPMVDEICVLDTGSKDNTINIAKQFGAITKIYKWENDFSKARNMSLSLATREWILAIDADERLTPESGPVLKKAISDSNAISWLIFQDNITLTGDYHSIAIPRLFKNISEIQFSRKVHESIMDSLISIGAGNPATIDVHLTHIGYLPEEIKKADKYERNKKILRTEILSPKADLFSYYKLAKTLHTEGERSERHSIFEQAVSIADSMSQGARAEYPFIGLLYDGLARCQISNGQLVDALRTINRYYPEAPTLPEIVWRRSDIFWRLGDYEKAIKGFESCLHLPSPDPRITSDYRLRTTAAKMRLGNSFYGLGDNKAVIDILGNIAGSDFYQIQCRTLKTLSLLNLNETARALEEFELLSKNHSTDNNVRCLQGQIALMQNEKKAALNLFEAASDNSDIGQRAVAVRAEIALIENDLNGAINLIDKITIREIETAATVLFIRVIKGTQFDFTQPFNKDYLLQKLHQRLQYISSNIDQIFLQRFMDNSSNYTAHLPGIEQLLVSEE